MFTDVTAIDLPGGQEQLRLGETPDVCPRCHRSVHPKVVGAAKLQERRAVQAIFRCTYQKCQELFIATYRGTGRAEGGRQVYDLEGVAPLRAAKSAFPDTVTAVSPNFVTIHDQALEAEAAQLDQLVGIGLRKAVEFLIKDFAIAQNQNDSEKIRSAQLAQCIANYVSDPNIKECARRATWLGNDETHYVRKWEDRDISDLKLLVRLTFNWIDNVLLTQKYVADMPGEA
jgi:hypothetical protein